MRVAAARLCGCRSGRSLGADVALAAADDGDGIPVVLLHGLGASRRYVVMGSSDLQRHGHRVVAYDARGHGSSSPAPSRDAYGYEHLCADLLAVLDELELERAVLAGASMGAHTILRLALEVPERVAGLVVDHAGVRPGRQRRRGAAGATTTRSPRGLRSDGIEGFVAARRLDRLPRGVARLGHDGSCARAWRATSTPTPSPTRSRSCRARGPSRTCTRSSCIECPAVVVADRDEADPGHPLELGEAYAELLPRGRLVVEAEGKPPLAWQGAQLSKVIAELAREAW